MTPIHWWTDPRGLKATLIVALVVLVESGAEYGY
jgi:hypothetical protein